MFLIFSNKLNFLSFLVFSWAVCISLACDVEGVQQKSDRGVKSSGSISMGLTLSELMDVCSDSEALVHEKSKGLRVGIDKESSLDFSPMSSTDLEEVLHNSKILSCALVLIHQSNSNPKYDSLEIFNSKILHAEHQLSELPTDSAFPVSQTLQEKIGEVIGAYKIMNLMGSMVQLTMNSEDEIRPVKEILLELDGQIFILESRYFQRTSDLEQFKSLAYIEITADLLRRMLASADIMTDNYNEQRKILEDVLAEVESPLKDEPPQNFPRRIKISEILDAESLETLEKSINSLNLPQSPSNDQELELFTSRMGLKIRVRVLRGMFVNGR